MRGIGIHIPEAVLRRVAIDMKNAYPDMFEERDEEGNILGNGVASLVSSMKQHNKYLIRPHMRFSASNTLKIPLKKQKSMKYIQSGCKNWQPEYNGKTADSEFEEYRLFLLNYKNVDITDEDTYATLVEKFQTCYPAQRFYLNNWNDPPTATDIASLWPCLFHKLFLSIHFMLLTEIDINLFASNFEKNLLKLLAYDLTKNL